MGTFDGSHPAYKQGGQANGEGKGGGRGNRVYLAIQLVDLSIGA